MTFALGMKSRANMELVVPVMANVAGLAILLSEQDFHIPENGGARSAAAQLEAWRRGNSKLNGIPKGQVVNGIMGTGLGPHQVKGDGFGRALDAVPWVDGKSLWEVKGLTDEQQWVYIYPVAYAFQQAARQLSVPIIWGGVFDRLLNDLPSGPAALKKAVADYAARHPGPDFLDGPHYELAV